MTRKPKPRKIIGIDKASPDGDVGCRVEGVATADGKLHVTKVEYLSKDRTKREKLNAQHYARARKAEHQHYGQSCGEIINECRAAFRLGYIKAIKAESRAVAAERRRIESVVESLEAVGSTNVRLILSAIRNPKVR